MQLQATTAAQARDEFLQLLVTQLRHQDPLDPVKQENFLSQLAQFSTLEGIEEMNASFTQQLSIQADILKLQQFSQASTMIGRVVEFEAADGAVGRGRVDSVSVSDSGTRLMVAGQSLSIDQVTAVLAESEVPASAE